MALIWVHNRFRIGSGWNSEALTIVGNGRIGMGRPDPYTKLHVKDEGGVLSLEGSTHCYINFYRKSGSRTAWFGNGGNTAVFSLSNKEIIRKETKTLNFKLIRRLFQNDLNKLSFTLVPSSSSFFVYANPS